MKISSVEAFVLAGGSSVRMGQNKQHLLLGGRSVTGRVCDLLMSVFEKVTMVVNRERPALPEEPLFVVDTFPGLGPLAGIHTALLSSCTEYVFVCGSDMPFLNGSLIRSMIEKISPQYHIITVETASGRVEPLHSVYSRACIPVIENMLKDGKLSVHSLQEKMKNLYKKIIPDDELSVFNINTPSDMDKAREILS